jgi:hypothetical protein
MDGRAIQALLLAVLFRLFGPVLLYFVSLYADMRFVQRSAAANDAVAWSWKLLGAVALVASVLAYEVTAVLFSGQRCGAATSGRPFDYVALLTGQDYPIRRARRTGSTLTGTVSTAKRSLRWGGTVRRYHRNWQAWPQQAIGRCIIGAGSLRSALPPPTPNCEGRHHTGPRIFPCVRRLQWFVGRRLPSRTMANGFSTLAGSGPLMEPGGT